jgi:hypothetical protein
MLQRIRERISPTDVVMWLIGGGLLFLVIWGSIATLIKGTYTTRHWIDFVIFGLAQGSVYALIATGYTMVYGVLRMIRPTSWPPGFTAAAFWIRNRFFRWPSFFWCPWAYP